MSFESKAPFYEIPTDIKYKPEEGAFAQIKEFKNNPNLIIKEIHEVLDETYFETDLDQGLSFDRFNSSVGFAKKILESTHTELKNYIPEVLLVYGQNEHEKEVGYIVMERIDGIDISRINRISPEIQESFEKVILACFEFYEEQKSKGRGYFPDLCTDTPESGVYEIHNLMYGTKPNESNKQVYMVDTYPIEFVSSDESGFFDEVKRALEKFYDNHNISPSIAIRKMLIKYGTTAFEPKKSIYDKYLATLIIY